MNDRDRNFFLLKTTTHNIISNTWKERKTFKRLLKKKKIFDVTPQKKLIRWRNNRCSWWPCQSPRFLVELLPSIDRCKKQSNTYNTFRTPLNWNVKTFSKKFNNSINVTNENYKFYYSDAELSMSSTLPNRMFSLTAKKSNTNRIFGAFLVQK